MFINFFLNLRLCVEVVVVLEKQQPMIKKSCPTRIKVEKHARIGCFFTSKKLGSEFVDEGVEMV
jgi:hypothetical protein